MDLSEMRELNVEELEEKLKAFKQELFNLRNEKAGGKLAKPHRIRQIRKDLARLMTVQTEKAKQ